MIIERTEIPRPDRPVADTKTPTTDDMRFRETRELIIDLLARDRHGFPRKEQSLRHLDYHDEGDGIVFLRSADGPQSKFLAQQFEEVHEFIGSRPMLPRQVVVACGFRGGELQDGR